MLLRNLFFISFFGFIGFCSGLTFQVEPKTTACLYDDFVDREEVTIAWEVVRGGLLDVNIKISGPSQVYYQELYFEGRGQPGSKTFVVQGGGQHSLCFDNEMSRWTPKVVSITVTRPSGSSSDSQDSSFDDETDSLARPEHITPLQQSISKISGGLSRIENEQSYYRRREHRHRNTAESTCSRVLWWSIGETLILITVSMGQVFTLRRWFSQKTRGKV